MNVARCLTVDPEGWRLTVSSDAHPPHTERGSKQKSLRFSLASVGQF